MATIQLTVVTPEGKLFEGASERVIVRATGGDVCVMARHIDFSTSLGKGEGRVTLPDGTVRRAEIEGGMLHAASDAVQIITNHFTWKEA